MVLRACRPALLCGLATAFAMVACSSSNDGGATVSGTIDGSAFLPLDAIAVVGQGGAQIIVTSTPNACADVQNNVQRANSRVIGILLNDADAGSQPLSAGVYTTSYGAPNPPAREASFEVDSLDAQCNVTPVPPPDGTGDGTVTVTSVNGATLAGTFDVILEDGTHVTGSFEPVACPDLGIDHSATPTCAPG